MKIWPFFLAIIISFILLTGFQLIYSQVLLEQALTAGMNLEAAKLERNTAMAQPQIFILNKVIPASLSGLTILLFAYLNFSKTRLSLSNRLGLAWPNITFTNIAIISLGSLFVFFIGAGIANIVDSFFNVEPLGAESRRPLVFQHIDNFWGIALIIVIACFPGFFEELAFRGFLQRGLMTRFSPVLSIGITALVFGIIHIEPRGIALSAVMGVWLGVVAWRTNSIWIAVICHAFLNGFFMFYQVGVQLWGFSNSINIEIKAIMIVMLIPAFVGSLLILEKSSNNEGWKSAENTG